MDTLAALAFGGEPALSAYLDEKPISREAPIIDGPMWSSILFNGSFIAFASITFLIWNPVVELYVERVSVFAGCVVHFLLRPMRFLVSCSFSNLLFICIVD